VPLCGGGECARRVFVSSTTTSGRIGTTGGIAAADALCQQAATAVSLTGTYRAWLSDDTATPQRFTQSKAPYVLVDGTRVAASFPALLGGQLENAIRRTEAKTVLNDAKVWTGTTPSGSLTATSPCGNWNNASATQPTVTIGNTDQTSMAWTQSSTQSCADPAHLYCFEQ
jgi:hypothetical protein